MFAILYFKRQMSMSKQKFLRMLSARFTFIIACSTCAETHNFDNFFKTS
jgi:hypothetical protein